MRIKSILVSQPAPSESSPYLEIAKKEKIKIDFRPFIHVDGVDNKELRAQKNRFNSIHWYYFYKQECNRPLF